MTTDIPQDRRRTPRRCVTGAASHGVVEWHATEWRAVQRTVRRLQARIVKAVQEGRWGKVKALQHLLTHSLSGRALAVRRVTENRGRSTPGVDGETWDSPARKTQAVHALRRRGYQPRPLRRVYIPKRNGKRRPLGIPTMHDRAMQALYLLALEPIAETTGDPNSYGFRRERCAADALQQCFGTLGKPTSPTWVLEGDITSCFDRISHEWLLAHVPTDRAVLRKWLKAGYMDKSVLHPTTDGTPQGGIISPVLANLALDGLERVLRRTYPTKRRTTPRAMVNLVRYADDFVITGSSKGLLETAVKPLVAAFLRERGLELSAEKTTVTHIETGFDFLGQHVRKYDDGKLRIRPSKQSIRTVLATLRAIIRTYRTAPAGALIERLNPVLRGWAYYHRHACSRRILRSVDAMVFRWLWQWAARRHPNKGHRWVRSKYFTRSGSRGWRFTGTVEIGDWQEQLVYLWEAGYLPIRRHVKIRSEANPFDPAWEVYFEARLATKMTTDPRLRRELIGLWKEQQGICPMCSERITAQTGWHRHHIVWRSLGGPDTAANYVLLHPTCHQQLHHHGLTVQKPRPVTGALKRLEPDEGQLSRPVLRGGRDGDAAPLPDYEEEPHGAR